MTMQQTPSFDGAVLAHEIAGEGEPTLVFVHGWSCNRRFFAPQFEHFSRRYRCVALDLAGHGRSAAEADRTWSIGSYARDVAALVRRVVPGKAVLIGHSMAGAVVTEAAPLCADKVAAVVLADTHVFDYGHLPAEEIAGIVAAMRADLTAFIDGLVSSTLPADAPAALVQWIKHEMSGARPEVAIPSLEALLHWDARPTLSTLSMPAYAINGTRINDTARARYRDYLREYTMPNVGHFLQLEDPVEFNRQLQAVLEDAGLAR